MQTMTSLQAQTNFGALLDNSQREAIIITRRGRPCSAVISNMGNPKSALAQFLMAMSELSPIKDNDLQRTIAQTFDAIGQQAEQDGLTENDINRLIHEARK